jgi:Domain of unknown function (DUF2017)
MTSVRRRGEHIRVSLDREEAVLLVSLVSQVTSMLNVEANPVEEQTPESEGSTFEQMVAGLDLGGAEQPDNPILLRLLPDGYRDDPEAAEEFRRLTDSELRTTKGRALHRLIDDVAAAEGEDSGKKLKIDLDDEAAESWLHAINDVRLALGTHLDIQEEGAEEQRADANEATQATYAIYDWLTWLQEAIVRPLING